MREGVGVIGRRDGEDNEKGRKARARLRKEGGGGDGVELRGETRCEASSGVSSERRGIAGDGDAAVAIDGVQAIDAAMPPRVEAAADAAAARIQPRRVILNPFSYVAWQHDWTRVRGAS